MEASYKHTPLALLFLTAEGVFLRGMQLGHMLKILHCRRFSCNNLISSVFKEQPVQIY